jgi:hypothetical protein
MKRAPATIFISLLLFSFTASARAHKEASAIAYVTRKWVEPCCVTGRVFIAHTIDLHSDDGTEFTDQTWCTVYVKVVLRRLGQGRSIASWWITAYENNDGYSRWAYFLDRRNTKARRVEIEHAHVDETSCSPSA